MSRRKRIVVRIIDQQSDCIVDPARALARNGKLEQQISDEQTAQQSDQHRHAGAAMLAKAQQKHTDRNPDPARVTKKRDDGHQRIKHTVLHQVLQSVQQNNLRLVEFLQLGVSFRLFFFLIVPQSVSFCNLFYTKI